MSKNTGDGELREQLEEFALHMKSGTTKGKHRTAIFDTLELTKLVQHLIAQEANKAQQQLLQGLMEELPSGEVDLIKFERDKTGWIEEVGVDPETLTDKDMIAVWRLARHFKQQAITQIESAIQNKLEGLS